MEPTPEQIREFVPVTQVSKWLHEAQIQGINFGAEYVAREAFRCGYAAGANAELQECCDWLLNVCKLDETAYRLVEARCPKPPSLKQQALDQLDEVVVYAANVVTVDKILSALESLPDD
jgi:hypothetical protein